jgi:2-polyprenyl-3-methyl-5-hydroxy-6-metoxy-1,4-benzoquinol methylase
MTKNSIQPITDLETWHKKEDPWGYENHPDDLKRKNILISEIPKKEYGRVLDIGCGQGFITRFLPGAEILGMDISHAAIHHARKYENARLKFHQGSLFDLSQDQEESYDLIVITGVLYPQYIGNSLTLVYRIIDRILRPNGILASVHIDAWYKARFPYPLLKSITYDYREYIHWLEIYGK